MRTWTPLTPAEALPRLERAVEAFAGTLVAGDPAAPVGTCPGWDLRALAHHLGNVHRWARGAIVEGHPDTAEVDAPDGRDALVGWYRDCAAALLDTLRVVDPGQECWAFGPKPRTAAFWFRRQLHETTMHGLDAALAAGGPVPDLEPVVALDGLDEVVTMFFPRQVRLRRTEPLTRSMALVPTDAGPEAGGPRWVLAGDGMVASTGAEGASAAHREAAAEADVEVGGPAQVLLELLWRRVGRDDARLAISGDRAALDSVLGAALTP
jgi:uncharacterized protein (TIGR03083 family)